MIHQRSTGRSADLPQRFYPDREQVSGRDELVAEVLGSLRRPLSVLRTMPAWVRDSLPATIGTPSSAEAGLKSIEAHVEAIEGALSDLVMLLQISQRDLTPVSVDVARAVSEIAADLSFAALTVEVSADIPPLAADAMVIRALLSAMLTEAKRRGALACRLRGRRTENGIRLTLTDEGVPLAIPTPAGMRASPDGLTWLVVWECAARLGAAIEIQPAEGGAHNRLTLILPPTPSGIT